MVEEKSPSAIDYSDINELADEPEDTLVNSYIINFYI